MSQLYDNKTFDLREVESLLREIGQLEQKSLDLEYELLWAKFELETEKNLKNSLMRLYETQSCVGGL